MIKIDSTHLLMIEPASAPSAAPMIDEATRKIAAAWPARSTSTRRYRGQHTCTGLGCRALSDNADHYVGDTSRETNSLCVHYVAYHRADVPAAELEGRLSLMASAMFHAEIEPIPSQWLRDERARAIRSAS